MDCYGKWCGPSPVGERWFSFNKSLYSSIFRTYICKLSLALRPTHIFFALYTHFIARRWTSPTQALFAPFRDIRNIVFVLRWEVYSTRFHFHKTYTEKSKPNTYLCKKALRRAEAVVLIHEAISPTFASRRVLYAMMPLAEIYKKYAFFRISLNFRYYWIFLFMIGLLLNIFIILVKALYFRYKNTLIFKKIFVSVICVIFLSDI